jgi:hypothetical protein
MSTLNIATADHVLPSRLWFGSSAGAAAWGLHGTFCVFIATHFCSTGYAAISAHSHATARLLLALITLLALAVTVSSGIISFQNWSRTSNEKDPIFAEALDREAYMALVGVFLNVVLAFGILGAGLPVLLLDLCVRTR